MVLTAVEHVFVKFGQANQQALTDVTVTAMQQYIEEDQFAPGSMLPKVEAAISFAESKPNRQAIIGLFRISFGSNQRRKWYTNYTINSQYLTFTKV